MTQPDRSPDHAPRLVEAPAHAKVNLALSVGAPIPPGEPGAGMHPICSWMACLDLHDSLRVERLDRGPSAFDLTWSDGRPLEWNARDDLTVRAHTLLETTAGHQLPVRITLRKTIPAGGGLGGGSSDAATVMRAIDELFTLGLGAPRLRALSASLGSDIAFFLDHHSPACPAIVSGLGDQIERLPRIDADLILVCPPFGCATGAVYRAYDASPAPLREPEVRAMPASALSDPHALFNDLAPPAQRVEPRLGEIRDSIAAATKLPVHVSGSGSTLFLVAPHETLSRVRDAAPGCQVIPAHLV